MLTVAINEYFRNLDNESVAMRLALRWDNAGTLGVMLILTLPCNLRFIFLTIANLEDFSIILELE
jgi:hypothetical protein